MTKGKAGDKAGRNVTPAEFVTAWESSNSLDEVAEKTGIPGPICAARASTYRRKYKLNLKLMRPGRKDVAIDVEELNKLIEAMGGAKANSRPAAATPAATAEQLELAEREQASRRAELLKKLLKQK